MSCPDCFNGQIHEGTPRGKITTIHNLNTYVSEPVNSRPIRGIIVIIPDAFGFDFVNNRLLADHYADKGDYKVYLPDFMLGHSAPIWLLDTMKELLTGGSILTKPIHVFWAAYGAIPWMLRNRFGRSYPIVKLFFSELRKMEGNELPIGAAGFCWGGKHALLLSQDVKVDGHTLLDACFVGHPSRVKIPEDIETLSLPVSFAIGDRDNQIPSEEAKKLKFLLEQFPEGQDAELRIYDNCGHGFCVRADVTSSDSDNARGASESEDQCINWFNKHLIPRT